jgi:hypothetical protein
MFCAFDASPMILRLYGKGQAENKGTEGLDNYRREKNLFSIDGFPTGLEGPG